jgi:hypothetical protein
MPTARAQAEALLERWRRGFRFLPLVEGVAEWPPRFRPAPWQPAFKMSPAQAAALAETRLNAIALQHKAGPLSKRRAFNGK